VYIYTYIIHVYLFTYVCIHVHLLQELGKVREGAGEKERNLITLETELNRYAADECVRIYIYMYVVR